MAGMFSLLHKSQMRLDANSSAMAYDDMATDFRATAPSSSPLPGRRFAGIGQGYMKPPASSTDRLPKRFRKRSWYHKCYEIHPVLRRSICTILLAVIGLLTGCTLFLVDYLKYEQISTAGVAILGISFAFCWIGIIWLYKSSTELKQFKKKLKKNKSLRENRQENIVKKKPVIWADPVVASATKWPVKRVCDGEEFDSKTGYSGLRTDGDLVSDNCCSTNIDEDISNLKEQPPMLKSDEYYSSSESLYETETHRKKAREAKGQQYSGDLNGSAAEHDANSQMVPKIFVTKFSSEQSLKHPDHTDYMGDLLEMRNIRA